MIKKIWKFFGLVALGLWAGGCMLLPETAVETTTTAAPDDPGAAVSPASTTPSSLLQVRLPEEDQIIFAIPNPEPWSGKEGDPRPGWKGWGAETFTVAPDGSVWIADTASEPDRLLHYAPQGDLLQDLSLQDLVVYPY
ncbi:MAG TPA: hypothetical protein VJ768_07295, partial [Anaerolineales bacterium]|nr:hypothetical protein [Anaerolineales bacterium]